MDENKNTKKEEKTWSRSFQLILVAMFLVVMGVSFGRNVLGTDKNPGVPEKLLEMKVGNYMSGETALKQVSQLHGSNIQMTDAIIAEYSHDFNPYHKNDDKVNVWIGKTNTIAEANSLVAQMVSAIQAAGNRSPFRNPRNETIGGIDVYQVDGAGGRHFFYALATPEPRVVWLSISSDNSESILIEALRGF